MRKNPLVSIVIPVYNQEKYIAAAIDSAKKQTYKNCEIVIHDNCSTDGTLQILKSYETDKNIRIIKAGHNYGMIGGWNRAISHAQGAYIKFLASDDLLDPDCVAELVEAMTRHPQAAIVTCRRRFIDSRGAVVRTMGYGKKDMVVQGREHGRWILTDLRENKIGEPTAVLYPRELADKAGVYDPQFSQFADFEYWIRLLAYGDLVYVHKPLCSFRLHEGSNTSAAIKDGRFITETFDLIRKYYYGGHYRTTFGLTDSDGQAVRRKKILDILKNCKDLMVAGRLGQAVVYARRLAAAVARDVVS